MIPRRFAQLDVFASGPFTGNPLAVVLDASVAQWLIGSGRIATPYVAAQGQALGRRGRVHVDAADGELWIGGRSPVAMSDSITLP